MKAIKDLCHVRGATMATKLTLDQMRACVRNHFEDFVNKRNAAVIHRNMTADFYDHDGPGGKPTGVEGDEKMMLAMYKSVPDLHVTIEDMIAEDDKVRVDRRKTRVTCRRHTPLRAENQRGYRSGAASLRRYPL
jgi:hypothetical protein